jgi:CPA1 family monovalent cation:H+ antiporter
MGAIMESQFQIFLILLAVLAGTALLARRTNVAPAILLMLAGIALAFVPGMPVVELPPELVLLLVLPPLIYSASVAMSWREFKSNLRPIILLAVGCVIFTAFAVAAATHYLIGLPWSVGFLLGAIVAPPDVVAPLAIARKLGMPRRILVVLEGEGLANDATALILYRFAVAAVSLGTFSFGKAALVFVAIMIGELVWGLAIGYLSLRLRRWAKDARVEIILSLLTPFAAYWPPESVGGSGVLATVVCGLYISWNGPLLIPSHTRLQGIFFWDLFIFLLEGALFLLTGLEARPLLDRVDQVTAAEFAIAALVTTVTVVIGRFLWVFPSLYLPRLLFPSVRRVDPYPIWQRPFLVSFFGVRGIVSLAAALALPLTTATGMPFPHRDLIILLTFWVILITLVGEGLTLPAMLRWLGLGPIVEAEQNEERAAEITARRSAIDAVLRRLDELARERDLPPSIVDALRTRHLARLTKAEAVAKEEASELVALHDEIEGLLIDTEREHIFGQLERGELIDEARRHIERELELREATLLRNIPGAANHDG